MSIGRMSQITAMAAAIATVGIGAPLRKSPSPYGTDTSRKQRKSVKRGKQFKIKGIRP